MKDIVVEHASDTDLRREKFRSMKPLQEKTQLLLEENKDRTLSSRMNELLGMTDTCMKLYYKRGSAEIPNFNKFRRQEVKLPRNLKSVCKRRLPIGKMMEEDVVEYLEQKPVCPWELDPDRLPVFEKYYWFSGIDIPKEKNYCDSDLLSLIQCLPDNYLWILQYFGAYSLLPLQLLETEVRNVEEYLKKLDAEFFGKRKVCGNIKEEGYYCRECEKCKEL